LKISRLKLGAKKKEIGQEKRNLKKENQREHEPITSETNHNSAPRRQPTPKEGELPREGNKTPFKATRPSPTEKKAKPTQTSGK